MTAVDKLRVVVTEGMATNAAIALWAEFVGRNDHAGITPDERKAKYREAATAALTAAFQHEDFTRQIEPQWLPIESAPRDGSCVLLADSDSVTPGFYHDGSECYGHRGKAGWFCEDERTTLLTASNFHATHWRPLPPPPANLSRLLGEEHGRS